LTWINPRPGAASLICHFRPAPDFESMSFLGDDVTKAIPETVAGDGNVAAAAAAVADGVAEATTAAPLVPVPAEPSPQSEPARPRLSDLRNNPDAIRFAFESGEYPYKTKMREKEYLALP
jgi:hypothetical protein